ncbi:P-loop NTPase fold protein [Acinetobacter haemolyticus]|uniref:P-loop NTPase fold protein n=1 Tax=Acinetobacter haemolyticus TaxID=29430 RepID=UPI0024DE4135|nr:P-loop NTPase fold protein [Acinetobacter haemolyticus]
MTKSIAKGMGGLLKGLKIDLTSFKSEDFLKFKPSTIFIFDDLERCKIDIDELFGHVNNLVEHLGAKTILIADESKIKDSKYSEIKEKLVDATFVYAEESLVAIDSILNEISDGFLKALLIRKKDNILNVFNLSDYKNLRSLKQTIYSFEHFFNQSFFTLNNNFDEEIFTRILQNYIVLSLEVKRGNFKTGILNFTEDPNFYNSKSLTEKLAFNTRGIKCKEAYDFVSKYNIEMSDYIFEKDSWNSLLLKRIIDKDLINKELDERYYRVEHEKPVWYQLMSYYDLEESEFDSLINQAKLSLQGDTLENWEDVIHAFSMLIYFQSISLVDFDFEFFKEHALSLFYKIIPINEKIKTLRDIEYREHASGQAFFAKGINSFEVFLDEVNYAYERKYQSFLNDKANELLNLMVNNPDLFYHRINLTNSSENLFYDVPILNEIDYLHFSEVLCDLPKSKLLTILTALRKRYKLEMQDPIYPKEKDWINNVVKNINEVILPRSTRLKIAKIEQRILPLLKEIDMSAYVGT